MKKIDFEAHFSTTDMLNGFGGKPMFPINKVGGHPGDGNGPITDCLSDLDGRRLELMDRHGIDIQVLSLTGMTELLPKEKSLRAAVTANDLLAETVSRHPERFRGFASIPIGDNDATIQELERCKRLGFFGLKTISNFGSLGYLDDEAYYPILEAAAGLEMPVFIHPAVPVFDRSLKFSKAFHIFGYTVDVAMTTINLMYAGVFDRLPGLKVIMGHLGETLPFLKERLSAHDPAPDSPAPAPDSPAPAVNKHALDYYLEHNIWVNTSGNHLPAAFNCTRESIGIDHILFGTDYPHEDIDKPVNFLEDIAMTREERDRLYWKNACELLGFK